MGPTILRRSACSPRTIRRRSRRRREMPPGQPRRSVENVEERRLVTADGRVVAEHVAVAGNAWQRFMGLMFRADLPPGHGLLLSPCNSSHMFFMRIPLDVAFLDRDGAV